LQSKRIIIGRETKLTLHRGKVRKTNMLTPRRVTQITAVSCHETAGFMQHAHVEAYPAQLIEGDREFGRALITAELGPIATQSTVELNAVV
jgi:hypothetical protein